MLALPLVGAASAYAWQAVTAAQQFDQKVDKVNPVVTTQNVALGDIDTRILNSDLRLRHGQTQPEFFARPTKVMVRGEARLYDPPANVDPSSNYNRAFIRAVKSKHMNPRQVKKMNTASDAILTTDMMARKLYKIDTSRWPY